jgi:hypothetical protein
LGCTHTGSMQCLVAGIRIGLTPRFLLEMANACLIKSFDTCLPSWTSNAPAAIQTWVSARERPLILRHE